MLILCNIDAIDSCPSKSILYEYNVLKNSKFKQVTEWFNEKKCVTEWK